MSACCHGVPQCPECFPALNARIAALTADLATARALTAATEQQLEIKTALLESERAAFATERAAREKAEETAHRLQLRVSDLEATEGMYHAVMAQESQAERERDTALEERGVLRGKLSTAESALASALSLLGRAHQFGISHPAIRRDVGAFLSSAPSPAPCSGCAALSGAIDQAIRDMLSGGHPFEAGVAKAINDLRAAQKEHLTPIDQAEASRRETGDW